MNAVETPVLDATELAAGDSKQWLGALTRAEIQELRQMNDWRSWASILTNWGLVFACFDVDVTKVSSKPAFANSTASGSPT